jgi:hypothetical protein
VGAISQDWYAGNATRAYPLDDAATARDDAGLELPPQILVDCRVRFPLDLGQFAYLGGVTVGPAIVTAILMAAPDSVRPPADVPPYGTPLQPLGAVSLPRPVVPNRHYPIQPLADGVGGWIVFGRGIDEFYSGRFSTPAQSLLLPRVASAYHPLPIPTLGKLGLADALTGVVQLLGGTDLEVVQDLRTINGAEVSAVIMRLTDSLNRNVYQFYTGPCDGRPESQSCGTPVLESINSVSPDCNGNLTIDFRGVDIYPFEGGGGLALDLALGLADVCTGQDYLPDDTGKLPSDYTGDCAPPEPPVSPTPTPTPTPPLPSGCTALPFYDSFDEPVLSNAWVISNGAFGFEADDSPGEPFGLMAPGTGAPLPGHPPGIPGLPPLHRAQAIAALGGTPINQCYSATSQSQRNVVAWDCDYDYRTTDLTCLTHLKLMPGPQINGGIVFNYNGSDSRSGGRPTYNIASVNPVSGYLEIDAYTGYSMLPLVIGWSFAAYNIPLPRAGDWYALQIRTRPAPIAGWASRMLIDLTLSGVSDPHFPVMSIPNQPIGGNTASPAPSKFGLGAYNAYTRFSFFSLEVTPP